MSVHYKITPAALKKNRMQKERISYHLAKLEDKTLKDISMEELEGIQSEENQILAGED